ncbi:MAG: energy transducer TonB [Terracidiphilus sp.]
MKKRITFEVDVDAPILKLKQLDFYGTVVVEVLVGASGEVVCAKSVGGIPFTLEPVERAVRAWTFKPEKQNGKPVAYLGQLDFLLCNGECRGKDAGVTLLK